MHWKKRKKEKLDVLWPYISSSKLIKKKERQKERNATYLGWAPVCCDVQRGDAFWSRVKTRPAAVTILCSLAEEGLIRAPGLRGCSRTPSLSSVSLLPHYIDLLCQWVLRILTLSLRIYFKSCVTHQLKKKNTHFPSRLWCFSSFLIVMVRVAQSASLSPTATSHDPVT